LLKDKTGDARIYIEELSSNLTCGGKATGITYSECVSVTLVIQHAKRMRFIILPFSARLTVPYFSTLSHKALVTEHNVHVLIFETTFI
jgi:hypothetical protein